MGIALQNVPINLSKTIFFNIKAIIMMCHTQKNNNDNKVPPATVT